MKCDERRREVLLQQHPQDTSCALRQTKQLKANTASNPHFHEGMLLRRCYPINALQWFRESRRRKRGKFGLFMVEMCQTVTFHIKGLLKIINFTSKFLLCKEICQLHFKIAFVQKLHLHFKVFPKRRHFSILTFNFAFAPALNPLWDITCARRRMQGNWSV